MKLFTNFLIRILQLSCVVVFVYNILTIPAILSDDTRPIPPDIKADIVNTSHLPEDISTINVATTTAIVDDLIARATTAEEQPEQQESKLTYRLERNVFTKLMERIDSVIDTCDEMPTIEKKEVVKDFDTGVPRLPTHGLHAALQDWIRKEDDEVANSDGNTNRKYPTCQLPPPTLCSVSSYSVIMMSHTISDAKRLQLMMNAIKDMAQRPKTTEIILVWNSDKEVLTKAKGNDPKLLIKWDQDTSHPLRIFYSLENGLKNNLLNRYHPSIQPVEEVVMYFDDDGPFFSEEVMDAGLQLWKFNSDTQVGCMPRNIRFTSKRMKSLQENATLTAIDLHTKYTRETYISPYDTSATASLTGGRTVSGANEYPKFTPVCNSKTGDSVEYNFFVFPHFQANMFLPSGTLLHRNFLCFIWHPAFEDLRQYILDHPTHPDDMLVSTLVSHLSGRILRTFPRRIRKPEISSRGLRQRISNSRSSTTETNYDSSNSKREINESPNSELMKESVMSQQVSGRQTRRLLWQQKNWANMREEAMNSIVNYVGSINPGSVGWCVGTQHATRGRKGSFECNPEFPTMIQIPWMNKDSSDYHYCR